MAPKSPLHDQSYERPIRARYTDPLDLVWLSACKQLGLRVRRDPSIFSRTDGTGLLAFGPRDTLDADDCLAQMVVHELSHWITNGLETYGQRDWGFPLDDKTCPKEHAAVRLQCWLATQWGLRHMFGPTGWYRQYWERLPEDPLGPIDLSGHPDPAAAKAWEAQVMALAHQAVQRSQGAPWKGPLDQAFGATRAILDALGPALADYATEVEGDALPSLWTPEAPG